MPVLKVKTQVGDTIYASDKKYHDENTIEGVINYVLRGDKTNSNLSGGIAVNPQLAKEQFEIVANAYDKAFGTRLRHMILSFGPNEPITLHAAKSIAYRAAVYYGYQYQIIWAVHTDAEHIHIHMVMNTVSYRTGMKYDGTKADYYRFKEYLNNILLPYGLYVMLVSDKK